MNLNETLLPVTPSMERFTIQARAFHAACSILPRATVQATNSADFIIFINAWMANNEHDELGDYYVLAELAADSR